MAVVTIALAPVAPFRLDLTAWVLRRRPDNTIDRWDGAVYRRCLALPGAEEPAEVAVRQVGPPEAPRLSVELRGAALTTERTQALVGIVERLLGLRRDLAPFYALAAGDPVLGPLAERFRGARPPRFPTLFEALANAIACQQVTLTLGITLLNRLAVRYGPSVEPGPSAHTPPEPVAGRAPAYAGCELPVAHAFVRPQDLAGLAPDDLRQLGFSRQKGRALIGLAAAALARGLDEKRLAGLADSDAAAALRSLHGIGRWSAEYALLRGLGRLSVFPGDDVGAQHNLERWLGLARLNYTQTQALVARWQPYAGLVYFHLLLDSLVRSGQLAPDAPPAAPPPARPAPGAMQEGV